MGYRVELLPDEPILYVTTDSSFSVTDDMPNTVAEVLAILDAAEQPLFYIGDIREVKIGLEDLIQGANMSARGGTAYLHHRNTREVLMISTDALVKMGAKGLQSATFGNVHILVFSTPEEAFAYAREKIARS